MIRAAAVVALLAGCPSSAAGPTGPTGPGPAAAADAGGPDAPEATEEAKLAAIEHAMNQLAPVANQCWAAGAADDFRLAGDVTLQIAPEGRGAKATVVRDTTRDAALTSCLQTVATAYAWPAELAGEVIELPFSFAAPKGQYVIDRRLVPVVGQAGVGVAVLIDAKNTGNPAASVIELAFKDGAALGLAKVERHEVWAIVGGGGMIAGAGAGAGGKPIALAAGDVVDVPAAAYREVKAGQGGMTAVVVIVPGGPEGVARGGAMPGERVYGAVTGKKPAGPKKLAATLYPAAGRKVALFLDPKAGGPKDVSLARSVFDAGLAVPEHQHAGETELLYVIAGEATMVVDGVTLPVGATSVVQIPKAVLHKATITSELTALQLYTPAGPEQRFKGAK